MHAVSTAGSNMMMLLQCSHNLEYINIIFQLLVYSSCLCRIATHITTLIKFSVYQTLLEGHLLRFFTCLQVLGHMKTVAVLILGWLLFDSILTAKNMLGMGLAVVGMIIYSWAVEVAKQQAARAAIVPYVKEASFSEEDVALLKSDLDLEHSKDIELALGAAK